MLTVRKATLDDVRDIVSVHTADEDLSSLSVGERYLHGGPWMSVETCSAHINALLIEKQLPVVAELEGRVVGEAETFFSTEPISGKVLKIAHIDVIEVHPDFRRAGIGRALVGFIENVAIERGVEFVTTQPDESALGFYRKLGFRWVLYDGVLVEIRTEGFESVEVKPLPFFPWEAVRSLELVAGRFQSSYDMWFSSFRDLFAGVHELKEAGKVGDSYYVLKSLPGRPGKASLFLWGSLEAVPAAVARAGDLGFGRVLTVLEREVVKYIEAEEKVEVPIKGKRLV